MAKLEVGTLTLFIQCCDAPVDWLRIRLLKQPYKKCTTRSTSWKQKRGGKSLQLSEDAPYKSGKRSFLRRSNSRIRTVVIVLEFYVGFSENSNCGSASKPRTTTKPLFHSQLEILQIPSLRSCGLLASFSCLFCTGQAGVFATRHDHVRNQIGTGVTQQAKGDKNTTTLGIFHVCRGISWLVVLEVKRRHCTTLAMPCQRTELANSNFFVLW